MADSIVTDIAHTAQPDGARPGAASGQPGNVPGADLRGTPDALARICAKTLADIARRREALPLPALERKAAHAPATRGFGTALKSAAATGYGLIAEIKMASPSGGMIRPDFDPAGLARAYAGAGAACLSVLTDGPHFGGDPAHLRAARAACALPVLRKDFILDPWQVYESRAMGADCILLIMAALSDTQAVALEQLARALGMDVLVEVHDAEELQRALGLQTNMIGINNRNLKTLQTDLNTTLSLSQMVPPERFLIAESGIRTHDDVRALAALGVHAFLVGEALLRQPDVGAATAALLGRDA